MRVLRRPAIQCRRIDHRKIQLLVRRVEAGEQIERLVDDPVRPGARSIDFVDDNDRPQAQRQRLAGDEGGLRHRSVHRIHQQQHRVGHRQCALHLAAEIGVAGRVDDIDAPVLPRYGGVFR